MSRNSACGAEKCSKARLWEGKAREEGLLQACRSLAKGTSVLAGPRSKNSVTASRAGPRIWECATLCGKRDFAGRLRLETLKWGKYPMGPMQSQVSLRE